MRSASFRTLMLTGMMLLAAAAAAQSNVNPHTQIRWPANCNQPGRVYNWVTNQCVVTADMSGVTPGPPALCANGAGGALTNTGCTIPAPQVSWPASCTSGVYSPAANNCVAPGTAANPAGVSGEMQINLGGIFNSIPGSSVDGSANVKFPQKVTSAVIDNCGQVCNVLAFGAKGDNGVTDNTSAITAACTAAKTYSPPAQVYFPKATGYYLTGTLEACAGVSLKGQPGMSLATPSGGTMLRGKPGQDIIHWHDPNTASGTAPTRYWDISDLNLIVDDTVDASASFPHRWPGRWTQDGTISLTTPNVLASNGQSWYCSDIGSAIKVVGAGAGGADLISTITGFVEPYGIPGQPCNGPQAHATLADAATTAVTNTLVYTSIPGVSATQTIGNCALGADNFDGNSAHWASGWTNVSMSFPSIHNVVVNTVLASAQNNSCGMYFQGNWTPYGIHVDAVNILRVVYAIVQSGVDTSPATGIAGQDQQQWNHMDIGGVIYPWISYNGGFSRLLGWQLASTYGPFILTMGASNEQGVNAWEIQVPEFELATSGTGWIITGSSHHLHGTQIAAAGARTYLDTGSLVCDACTARDSGEAVTINGWGNRIDIRNSAGGLLTAGAVVDNGVNNRVTLSQLASPGLGGNPSRMTALNITRESGYVGSRTPEFAIGNAGTPYFNRQDLFFFPKDYKIAEVFQRVNDAASLSGQYVAITNAYFSSEQTRGFSTFNAVGGQAVISNTPAGGQVPASVVSIYESSKCPVQTSYTFQVQNAVGTTIASATFPCTTTYATNSIVVDLSAQNGKSLGFGWAGITNEIDSAWIAVVPFSVSSTPGKNTSPKTSATSTTLDSTWLPFPTTSTGGGVQAKNCTGTGHVLSINTDSTVTCSADAAGGLPNTLGCLQGYDTIPCLVAKVPPTDYTSTSTSSSFTLATPTYAGTWQMCGTLLMTVAGTAGTYTVNGSATTSGHATNFNVTNNVPTTPQWSASWLNASFPSQLSCITFPADASAIISFRVLASAVTGTPTVRYGATLTLLSN